MTRSRTLGAAARHGMGVILTAVALALAFFMLSMNAQAKAVDLSDEDKECLECHAQPKLSKTAANGDKLSLFIRPNAFAESAHGSSGCEGCHTIDLDGHDDAKPLASKRALAVEMKESCNDCHKKAVAQFEDSVHAALLQEGNDKAPLCSSCHNPHATPFKDSPAHAASGKCDTCHEKVAKAYATSVHSLAGDDALSCADCHRTHNIKAAGMGEHLKKECLSCHRDTVATHKVWLPNTGRHLEAVSCAACHSPEAKRRVNLRFYEARSASADTERIGVPQFTRLAHAADGANGGGLDSRALWSLLQEFNRDSSEGKTVLRGRLEVRTGAEAHQLLEMGLAIKECDTCHRAGAESFQSVTVSMAGPDGRLMRHDAKKGILTSVESIEAVGGFYALGSTRIKVLDILLVLTLAAGVLIPIAHFTLKWLFRGVRARRAAEAAAHGSAAHADRAGPPPPN
jgi:hypothetical protein